MNLHQLKIFCEVAKYKSITKAADALFISQPAVTKQIKILEKSYGIKLIEANGRNIEITKLGEKVFDLSKDIFVIEKEVENMLTHKGEKNTFSISIIGNYPAVSIYLPPVLKAFYKLNDQINIKIRTGNTYSAIEALVHNDVHLVMTGALNDEVESLEHCKLFSDPLCFIINKNHPLSGQTVLFKDIASEQFIGRLTESYSYNRLKQIFLKENLKGPHIKMSYDLAYDGYMAVSQYEAIYFGSYNGTLPILEEYNLEILNVKDVPQELLQQDMYITSTKDALKRREVKELFNFIQNFDYKV